MRTRACLLLAAVLVLLGGAPPILNAEQPAGALARPAGVFSQYGGTAQSIALQGEYAYVGLGPRLLVFRLAGVAAPVFVGRSGLLPGVARRIVFSGAMAYVAVEKAGVAVVSVANPVQPVLLGVCDTPGTAMGVALLPGNRVAVADAEGGLRIVDASDPAHPAEVGSLTTNGPVRAVCASGSMVYLAEAGAKPWSRWTGSCLRVVDATDPAHPVSVSFYEVEKGLASSIVLKGTTVYVGSNRDWDGSLPEANGAVQAFDVSNPTSPVAGIRRASYISDMAISGDLLYVAEIDGTGFYDLSTPMNPRSVGGSVTYRGVYALATTADGLLYAVEVNRLLIERRSTANPGDMDILQAVDLPGYGNYFGVEMRGGLGYVVGGRLQVFDLSLQSGARVLGAADVGGSSLTVGERYAYVAARGGAGSYIYAIDIANPANPTVAGSVRAYALQVELAEDHLYTLDGSENDGLFIYDLSNPTQPHQVGALSMRFPWESTRKMLAVQGNYAYVATGPEVRVIDVSDPAHPAEAGVFAGDNWDFIGLSVSGNRAYVTQHCGFTQMPLPDVLLILDVSDPANIVELGRVELPEWPYVGRALGNIVYVANGDYGVHVIDASDPAHPVEIASYPLSGHCYDVAMDGAGRVLAACHAGGVYVLTPELPYSTYLPLIRRP